MKYCWHKLGICGNQWAMKHELSMERIILNSQFEVYKHTQKEKYVDIPAIRKLQ